MEDEGICRQADNLLRTFELVNRQVLGAAAKLFTIPVNT
jgi:hypothetical protein